MDISGLYDSLKSVKHSVENKIGKSISTESFREALDYCSEKALRNNKNTDIKKDEILDNDLLQVATKKMKKNDVDNTTISMVNNYFYDMKIVMEKMYNYLNKNGYMFIVVGNSFYGGVPIITDEILISEAVKIGFTQVDMIVSRKLSTSSQQMKIISDENRIYLRESIIVLRKDK